MTRRTLALVAVLAALVVPAVSLADDGGGTTSTPTSAPAALGGHRVRLLARLERRLDRRFAAFSAKCLVQNAPERCATAADRLATRLERLQGALQKVKTRIGDRCSSASAPPRCSRSSELLARIDDLLGRIADDLSAIHASYPGAGSATG